MNTRDASRVRRGVTGGIVFAVAAAALGLQGVPAAATTIINVSIGTETSISGTYGTAAGQYLMPEPYTGSNWHNLETSGSNLSDTDGNPTTIGVSLANTSGASASGPSIIPPPYMDVVKDYRYRNAGTTLPYPSFSLTVSGLTVGQAYDMHFILQGNQNEGGLVTMTSGAAVLPASAGTTGAGRGATSFTEGVNFASQSFTANATSAVFSVTRNSSNQFATISGLQIVAVPEPAAIGWAAGGLIWLGARVRRRNRRN